MCVIVNEVPYYHDLPVSWVALISFAFLISEELLWNCNFSRNSLSALNRPTWLQIWLPRQQLSSPFQQLLGPLWNWNCCLGRVQRLVCGIRIVDLSQSVFKLGILVRFVQQSFRKRRLGFDFRLGSLTSVWGNPSSWQFAQAPLNKSVNVDGVWLAKILIRYAFLLPVENKTWTHFSCSGHSLDLLTDLCSRRALGFAIGWSSYANLSLQ